MPKAYEVKCIKKRLHKNPHERIAAIGGDGWGMSEDQAIAGLQAGTITLIVLVGLLKQVSVIVAYHEGRPYLKTTADGYEPNNLLNLPDCPSA